MVDPIRICIGGGPEHFLPTIVLEHSIRRHAAPYKVMVYPLLDCEEKVPIPEHWKRKAPTSFSLQRFLLPEFFDFQGRAIYLDSDQIVQACICDLWFTPFPPGAKVLTTGGWQSAVFMCDCSVGWRVSDLAARMDAGELKYTAVSNLRFCPPGVVAGALDPLWNVIDRPDPKAMDVKRAKLLHYTDMGLQPWLNAKHPHGARWVTELRETIAAGVLTPDDVLREIRLGNVRPSLALAVGEEQPYDDRDFVYPDQKRKSQAVPA